MDTIKLENTSEQILKHENFFPYSSPKKNYRCIINVASSIRKEQKAYSPLPVLYICTQRINGPLEALQPHFTPCLFKSFYRDSSTSFFTLPTPNQTYVGPWSLHKIMFEMALNLRSSRTQRWSRLTCSRGMIDISRNRRNWFREASRTAGSDSAGSNTPLDLVPQALISSIIWFLGSQTSLMVWEPTLKAVETGQFL